jgi:hypothetical protein
MTPLSFVVPGTVAGVDLRLLIASLGLALLATTAAGVAAGRRRGVLERAALAALAACGGAASGPKVAAAAQRSSLRSVRLYDVYRCMGRLEAGGFVSFVQPAGCPIARESGITSFYWLTEQGRRRLGADPIAPLEAGPPSELPQPPARESTPATVAATPVPAATPAKDVVQTVLLAVICYRLYVTFAQRHLGRQS